MAQLKDTIVTGDLSVTGTIWGDVPVEDLIGTLPIAEGGTGNTTGTAALATTAADTTNELIALGVTSGATTTLKRDTNLLIKSNTVYPPAVGKSSVGTSTKPFFKGFFDTAIAIKNSDDSGERGIYVENTNGSVSVKVANARGLFDGKDSEWMVYKSSTPDAPTRTTSYVGEEFAIRNVAIGTDEPSGGNNGDVYIQYTNSANLMSSIIDIIYPVGSIYMNTENINPSILFGGTWERIRDRFLLGLGNTYGTVGETGGSATVTLTTNQMPSHYHNVGRITSSEADGYGLTVSGGFKNRVLVTGTSYSTENAGGGQAHNNMPPYLVVCMWKRIA